MANGWEKTHAEKASSESAAAPATFFKGANKHARARPAPAFPDRLVTKPGSANSESGIFNTLATCEGSFSLLCLP